MQNNISDAGTSQVFTRPRLSPVPGRTCTGLDDGNSPENAAVAAFVTLSNNCAAAAVVVDQNPFGPYSYNGSCHYGCSYEQGWSWGKDYRPYANGGLLDGIAFMNWAGSYTTAYQPTQTWLGTSLPNYTKALLTAINAADFENAVAILQNNMNEANQALQLITSFSTGAGTYTGYLQARATNLQSDINTDAAATQNKLIGEIHCGSGDVQDEFSNMLADVASKFVNIQAPLNTINSSLVSALQAVDLVAGVFVTLQSKNQLVSRLVGQASQAPSGSPIRHMYQEMAISEWTALVSEANAQLGG